MSIKYSSLEDEDKTRAIQLWEKKWNAFVEGIIASGAH
jgi:hypothetical protein